MKALRDMSIAELFELAHQLEAELDGVETPTEKSESIQLQLDAVDKEIDSRSP